METVRTIIVILLVGLLPAQEKQGRTYEEEVQTVARLKDQSPEEQRITLQTLGKIRSDTRILINELLKAGEDIHYTVWPQLIAVISELIPYSSACLDDERIAGSPLRRFKETYFNRAQRAPKNMQPQLIEGFFRLTNRVQFFNSYTHTKTPTAKIAEVFSDDNEHAGLELWSAHTREIAAELIGLRGNKSDLANLKQALKSVVSRAYAIAMTGDNTGKAQARLIAYSAVIKAKIAQAMIKIAPDDPEVIAAYAFRLKRGTLHERREAIRALLKHGEGCKEATSALIYALSDSDSLIVREAVVILGMLGPEAKAAIPLLEKLAKSEDRQIREPARIVLRQVRERR